MTWANAEKAKEYNRRYYRKHKQKSKEQNSIWRNKHKDDKRVRTSQLYRAAKHRAKRLSIAFDIEYNEILWPDNCPVLKIPLWYKARDTKRMGFNSPSLDRINPKMGYVKGNVKVISVRANTIKQNATAEEIQAVFEYVKMFS